MPDLRPAFPAWQRGIRRIRLIFETWYPWNHKRVVGRIRPLKFRRMVPEDHEWCLKLYSRNERYGVPESGRPLYEEYLESREHLVLIAEDADGRVGTFGIHRPDESTGYISYLLVDPGAHRSGVGTTLVLAAAALLELDRSEKYLMLTAFDGVRPFYRSLAFVSVQTELHEGKRLHHLVLGPLPPMLIGDCREMLSRGGVNTEDLRFHVPLSKTPVVPGNLDIEE